MTEEVSGQQPTPQGEPAINANQEVKANESVKTPETAPNMPDQGENAEIPKKPEKAAWYIDTISGLRIGKREAEEKARVLEAENAALKAGQKTDTISLTDAEIDKRAAEKAAINQFNDKCNNIAEQGKKDFATFDAALANLRAVGALGENSNPAFLQTVAELPNAHKLLNHLGNNLDEAARINSLTPLKMAIELARIETAINTVATKPVSKAAAPITPITGGSGVASGDLSDPNISMDDFARIRNKQREERHKRS